MSIFKPAILALFACTPQALWAQQVVAPQELTERAYIKETHGDWDLQCLAGTGAAEDPCQMYQLLTDSNGTPVMEATFFKLEGRGIIRAGASITAPLETLLTEKLSISVDGGKPRRYEFSFCTEFGCYARLGFTEEDITQFKRGAVAKLTIVPALAPDQTVSLDLSLKGFTASYAKVSTRQ